MKEKVMSKYIGKRLLEIIPTFLLITVIVYTLSSIAPGNPVDLIKAGGADLTPEAEAQLISYYGLDKPVFIRYLYWLGHILQGDFGLSSRTNMAVGSLIFERLGPTLLLTGTSFVIAFLLSVVLGIMAAAKPHSAWDHLSSFLAFSGVAVPNFLIALTLVYFFAVRWGLLPALGMYSFSGEKSAADLLRHMALPCTVIVLQIIGIFIKETRGSMLDVMHEEYITAARAKGISETAVILRHVFRNALIPVVSCVTLVIPYLAGGAVVTEQIFGWPGMGNLLVLSISQRDYNVIMGITVLISAVVLIANLLVDLVYARLDPRIQMKG